MRVTVAIATRDRPEMVARCVDAVMQGERPPDEIVLVDQTAGDATRVVAEAVRAAGAPLMYVHEPRGGLGTAQNAAFAAATSELVAVTDDDCVPAADWLAIVDATLSGPEAPDALTGRVVPLGDEQPGRYAVASRTSTVSRRFVGRQAPWDVGSGNNFALRRTWFTAVGGCDERLGPGAPGKGALDMDLFYRLLRAGATVLYEPAACVEHERATIHGRVSRRYPYGFGMGAATMLWLREGDRYAVRVLIEWLGLRLRILARALARGRLRVVREELLVIGGTAAGVLHGLRLGRAA